MQIRPRHGTYLLFAALAWLAIAATPRPGVARDGAAPSQPGAVVTVGGEVAHPLRLDQKALAALPRHDVTASVHGQAGTWSGVALSDILRAAGAPLGEKLRGKNMLLYVRIGAADGYHVVYALAELDPGFRDDDVILDYLHVGKPLAAQEGPFRVIAPKEKRPARWIREVTRIDVLRAPQGANP